MFCHQSIGHTAGITKLLRLCFPDQTDIASVLGPVGDAPHCQSLLSANSFTIDVTGGAAQEWGSGGDRHQRRRIVCGLEFLSIGGTEGAVIDGATNLQQEIGATP
jgi:hypothetical protein